MRRRDLLLPVMPSPGVAGGESKRRSVWHLPVRLLWLIMACSLWLPICAKAVVVTPSSGPIYGGTSVTLTGSGFVSDPVTEVYIGGYFVDTFAVINDTTLTAITPVAFSAGPADVEIFFQSGFSDYTANAFTYEDVSITSVTPSTGPVGGGTTVTIKGKHFAAPITAAFGGISIDVNIVDSQTLTAVTLPEFSMTPGPVDVELYVSDAQIYVLLSGGFTYVQPIVTDISPAKGPLYGGTPITINGSGFSSIGTADVLLGLTPATGVNIVSDTAITAVLPPALSAGPANLDIQFDSGQTGSAFLADAFSYENIKITSVSPAQGPLSGGTRLRIDGDYFTEPMQVTVDLNDATDVQVLNENTLLATTPAVTFPSLATVSLDVTGSNASASLVDAFSYVGSVVNTVLPVSGSTLGGTYVEINGSNVPNGATVLFGGVPATDVTVIDKDKLSAISPPHTAGAVTISINDSTATYTLPNAFTYVEPPPVITGISPAVGLAAGGQRVTITGSGFLGGAGATLGGQNLGSLTVIDSTTVSGTVPALPLGPADVVITNPDGQKTTLVGGYNVVNQLPQASIAAGDVAPYGAPDGALNAGDLVVLQQFLMGSKAPTADEILRGDVAPLDNPDGILNAGDAAVLTRALLGQITLNPLGGTSGTPAIDGVTPVSGQNPYAVTGTALPNTTVDIYVNEVLQQQVTSDANGIFSVNVVLSDGQNAIYASADDGSGSPLSTNHVQVSYENTVNRNQSGVIPVDTAWTAGSTPQPYRITSDLIVAAGTRLTLQPGVVLEFDDNAGLIINGELQILGSADQPVILTSSNRVSPAKGLWSGIQFGPTSANSTIDGAIIEWATTGIKATTTSNLVIKNSLVSRFNTSGIHMGGGSVGSIVNNVINNLDKTGSGIVTDQSSPLIDGNTVLNNFYGIDVLAASPLVQNNRIQENVIGIHIHGDNANPVVSGNVLVGNTQYGVQITGTGQDATNPRPVISGNNLYGNATAGVYVTGYGANSGVVLDLTNNWWGDTIPALGNQIVVNSGDTPATVADISNPQTSPSAGPVFTALTVTESYISPNASPGLKDISTISAGVSEPANWTITIVGNAGIVRTYSGTGVSMVASWDGRDAGGGLVADGKYAVAVSATSTGSGLTSNGKQNFPIIVDNTPPVAAIDFALKNATYKSVLNLPITGQATDANPRDYLVEFGAGAQPVTWTPIVSVANTGVSSGVLANWAIADAAGVQVPNGLYSVRLSVNDAAGNSSADAVTFGIANALIYNISFGPSLTIKPAFGEAATVNFSVLLPSTTVKYIISDERTRQVIRTIQQLYGPSSNNVLSWDGKDEAGNYVPDEAYTYTLSAYNGVELQDYTPVSYEGTAGFSSGGANVDFDPANNQFWTNSISLREPSRLRVCIAPTSVCTPSLGGFNALDGVPFEEGTHWVHWDGYDPLGNPYSNSSYTFFVSAVRLPPNSIIVSGNVPFVSGEKVAPNIEVKSNPYRITHSYEEQTQMRFQLDQDSVVTVKLLPPGRADPNDPSAQTLIDAVTLAAESSPGVPNIHTAVWKGYDDSVPSPDTNNILVSTEGTYTFTIEATSVVTGLTSLYRGAVTLYR